MLIHKGFRLNSKMAFPATATLPANDLTPSVLTNNFYRCSSTHSAARSITMLDDGIVGQVVFIIGGNPTYKTTLVDGGNLKLNGNWVEALNSTIQLIFDGTNWYELSRSTNG